ncbi:MAG TPA: DUF5602 domain-containing protein [Chitinophagaceae bacterium]|nr:DUF5602 domain-containing protein [Chitinophagaceae bacterium]
MKRKSTTLLWVLSITLLSLSCNQNLEDYFNPDGISNHVYRGPIVKMGNGSIRSVFTVSPTGVPLKIGLEMTDAAFDNLPTDPMDFEHSMFIVSIPQKAKDLTAFDHMMVNWNVQGHEPVGVYDKPHFDFHFFKVKVSEQINIPPYGPETAAAFDALPPDGYMPPTFVPTPGGVPTMGKHWADTKSDEANGKPFTKTFIYGSYNSATTFMEPMITLATLQSGEESSTAIDQPKYFAPEKTYYPTKYEITRDARKHTHTVSLTDFVWRQSVN